MSLHAPPLAPIAELTSRMAHASFPKGTLAMDLRDALGSIYEDADFAHLFPRRGRAAEAPWRLALVTVLQAVSMAAGLTKTAKAKQAKILRLNPSSSKRDEVPVDLKSLLAGKIDDVPMQPEDILFVPNSSTHSVTVRALEAALQVSTGVAILAARP